jgi:tetratricopeptide (TPR) repeat protein
MRATRPSTRRAKTIGRRNDWQPPRVNTLSNTSAPMLPAAASRRWPSLRVGGAFLDAALAARRAGTLEKWLRRHSGAQAWLRRELLLPIEGAQGHWGDETPLAAKFDLLLRWALGALRPDSHVGLASIPRDAWLDKGSWRPLLAVACYYGFESVPEFNDRYRRRPQETPADNLCGLWDVGPSTFYRYVDRGKRMLAESLLAKPLSGEQKLSLRRLAHDALHEQLALGDAQTAARHTELSRRALAQRDPASALWHCLQARDTPKFTEIVERFGVELAASTEVDALLAEWQRRTDLPLQDVQETHEVPLLLATGHLWRHRKHNQRERECYEQALRIAALASDGFLQGMAYSALGKYYEARDADRALVCYWDSIKRLESIGHAAAPGPGRVAEEQAKSLIRLAWLLLHKNDPQARTLLNQASALQAEHGLSDALSGLLDKGWAEYWRRAGNRKLALQHLHKALNTFERLDDRAQVFSTGNNLGNLYSEAGETEQAFRHLSKLVDMARHTPIDPYDLAGVHTSLGVNYFDQARYDEAIAQYQIALSLAESASLTSHIGRIRYNLAEAHYKRFALRQDPADESTGDAHAHKASQIWESEKNAAAQEATRSLKRELLGPVDRQQDDRLVPEEFAAHFAELGDVQRCRATLAMPAAAPVHARARLDIARAYLAIAAKEREAALALIQQHGLDADFEAELTALRTTFNRTLAREERLAEQWQQLAADLLADHKRSAALHALMKTGSINKSGYAQVCDVSLATASKHLGLLAERGLLVQTGKGPATRYLLPSA